MALDKLLSSPVVVFILFMGVGSIILYIGSKISHRGHYSKGKHSHYACGEDLATPDLDLNYHAFYRLALLFGICHITALVISTIPTGYTGKVFPFVYIVGALLSLAILWERKAK